MAATYKRGQTYWARAQRKGVEYRQSLGTGNKAVAEKRLRQWLDELEATSWGDRPRIAFAEAVRHFMIEHLPTLKPSSAERYAISLEWLAGKFDGVFLDDIGREELSAFEGWRRGLGVSNSTIRRDLACLSSVFSFCEDRERIADNANPVPAFMRRRAKRGLTEGPERKRYLSEAEERRILECASPAVSVAICMAIDTGLRKEEMFSLKWPQLDFKNGTIQTTDDTKSGRIRTVPFPPRSAQMSAQLKDLGMASFFVFSHANGKRIGERKKGFAGAVARAGLKDVRWHDLRRTAGCRWLQRDKRSMLDVSMLLGHAGVQITEKRYAFLEMETIAREVAAQKQERTQ